MTDKSLLKQAIDLKCYFTTLIKNVHLRDYKKKTAQWKY